MKLNQMKPFNLEKALAGEPVMTRDGGIVKGLHKCLNDIEVMKLRGFLYYSDPESNKHYFGREELEWQLSGVNSNNIPNNRHDLFMYEKRVKGWIWVHKEKYALEGGNASRYDSSDVYESREDLINAGYFDEVDGQIIEIEIGVKEDETI